MSVIDDARAWAAQDPDPVTVAELEGLIRRAEGDGTGAVGDPAAGDTETGGADAAIAALHDRFDSRLAFGTAGLRGEIGAGPNRMNRVLVTQAAAGLADWLLSRQPEASVVIGFDGRTNSEVFARDTAEIMAGAGVRAILLPRLLPTPVLAFAVRELGASAGVMVTASHNPAADNGYKVYLGGDDGGSQIVAPSDAGIAASIRRVAEAGDIAVLPRSREFETAPEAVIDEYVRRTAELADIPTPRIRFVYTAMHGVGWEVASRVFAQAGLLEPVSVEAQQEPDASFPTVSFPNPEEPGALDLAIAAASDAGVDLIVANDPDADRLAIAIPDGDGWRRLSGNEVGALLGWRSAERLERLGRDGTFANSLVSSPALRAIATAYRLDFVETLTGFKWISRAGGLAFGYEEALGYLVDPEKVRDKDGISAAVDFLALAEELRARGATVGDRLVELADRFGAFDSAQISVRVTDLADIPRIMTRMRAQPPRELAGIAVDRIDDYTDGFGAFSASDILRIWLADGSRVIVRPSGTEPKLKVYIDASSHEGSGEERRAAARSTVESISAAMHDLIG